MSLYRCAACGSPNVVTDTEKEGYSFAKGAVGTVLLGVGGAAAGINGKSKTVYKCPDCGTTLSYSMSFELKTLIDMGVMSEKVRDNLELNGVKIDWITLTSKYKNIESSSFVATSTPPVQETNAAPQVADKVVENTLSEEERNANREKYEAAKREHKKAHEKWEDACLEISEKREALVSEELLAYESKMKNEIEQDIKKTDSNFKRASNEIKSKIKKAETDLAGLGFFKFKEKKQLKNDLINLENQKATLSADYQKQKSSLKTQLEKIAELSKKQKSQLQKSIEKKNPRPKAPDIPKELFIYDEYGNEIEFGILDHAFGILIRDFLTEKGMSSFSEIKKGIREFEDYTEKRVLGFVENLERIEVIKKSYDGKKYYIVCDTFIARERRLKASFRAKYPELFEFLEEQKEKNELVTLSNICESVSKYSGKIDILESQIRELYDEGIVDIYDYGIDEPIEVKLL